MYIDPELEKQIKYILEKRKVMDPSPNEWGNLSEVHAFDKLIIGDKLEISPQARQTILNGYAPGYEITNSYKKIESDQTFAANVEASSTALITGNTITLDGGDIWVHVWAPGLTKTTTATDQPVLTIWEDGTNVGRIFVGDQVAASAQRSVDGWLRRTPSAGSHQYILKGYIAGGDGIRTASLRAGAGGAGNLAPAFMRILKV